MKKLSLLTTLLIGGLLLSGCSLNLKINDTSNIVDEDKPSIETESGRIFACNEEVGKFLNITTFAGGWNGEEEAGASFVLDGEITYEDNGETIVKNVQCVVDMVDKSVIVLEIESKLSEILEEPEGIKCAEGTTRQCFHEDCTEGDECISDYCGCEDENDGNDYNQFLEDIKSSGEQPQRINDYPEEAIE